MKEALKDKGSEVLAMLEISAEFPDEFEFVNQLVSLENERQKTEGSISDGRKQAEYMKGLIEAKKVYLEDKNWARLLEDKDC